MQTKKIIGAILSLAFLLVFFTGCQDDVNSPHDPNLTDKEAMLKIALEDEAIGSFEPNYTDDEVNDFLGKVNTEVYPVRIGRRIQQVSRDFEVEIVGDTAYATLVRNFEGFFVIPANYDSAVVYGGNGDMGNGGSGGMGSGGSGHMGGHGDNGGYMGGEDGGPNGNGGYMGGEDGRYGSFGQVQADTIIEKAFSTQVIQKIIFEKIDDTPFSEENWRVAALSLPEGGTLEEGVFQANIEISRVVLSLPEGESVEVTSPNDFFVERGMNGGRNRMPSIGSREVAHILVELNSVYPDTDLVTLTWGGGMKLKMHNRKRVMLQLVSQEFDGEYYHKVYEADYTTHINPGFSHTVINVMPYQSLHTDDAPVEENSWGIPYRIF